MSLVSLLDQPLRARLEEYRQPLYRLAYAWCHDAALADDLVQDTLCRALDNMSSLREAQRLKSWLFAILANRWRDHFRRQRDTEDIDELADHRLVCDFTPEDASARNQIAQRVRAAVARLPMGQRQVVTLVDLEGFSYAESSEILAVPVGTVMSRLCRARQALKGWLAEAPAPRTATIRSVK